MHVRRHGKGSDRCVDVSFLQQKETFGGRRAETLGSAQGATQQEGEMGASVPDGQPDEMGEAGKNARICPTPANIPIGVRAVAEAEADHDPPLVCFEGTEGQPRPDAVRIGGKEPDRQVHRFRSARGDNGEMADPPEAPGLAPRAARRPVPP